MGISQAVTLLTLLFCCQADLPNDADQSTPRYIVIKCCDRGYQLDKTGDRCIQRPGWKGFNSEQDVMKPPMEDSNAYWVPSFLRNVSLVVLYGERTADWRASPMDATDELVHKLLNIEYTEQKFELSPFNGRVDSASVRDQFVCFDAMEGSPERIVFITSVYLRSLFKCCAKGERLHWETNKCEQIPGEKVEKVREEILAPFKHSRDSLWLPVRMRSVAVRVLYGYRPLYQCNIQLNADDTSWRLLGRSNMFNVWVNKTSTLNVGGVSRFYCLDETGGKALYPRVLTAIVTDLTKCCSKANALSAEQSTCVNSYEGIESDDFEVISLKPNSSHLVPYWIPPQLHSPSRQITVKYGDTWQIGSRAMFWTEGTNQWHIEYTSFEEPTLVVTLQLPSGQKRIVRTQKFCFEVLADRPLTPRVIMVDFHPKEVDTIFKCCSIGRRLSYSGVCENNPGDDWSPMSFGGNNYNAKPVVMNIHKLASCRQYPFQVIRDVSETELMHEDQFLAFKASQMEYCYDMQPGKNGANRGVLAYCNLLPTIPLYQSIRPLQVVAVALLAAAVAIILKRKDMGRSAGLALAFHAACLMMSNGLQAIWFFTSNPNEECDIYAYAIYFFLTASALWLNALTANLAYHFRQPLGVLARGGSGGGVGWRRLVVLSSYVWGVSIAMTAFAIYTDQNKEMMIEKGFIPASFYETRTCRFQQEFAVKVRATEFISKTFHHDLGALLYFYVPSMLLVVANCVFLGLFWRRIKELGEDSSRLDITSHPLRSTVIYVKLLLSAGVLELLLEMIAWGVRPRISYYGNFVGYYVRLMENALMFAILATFVDLLRAVAVLWLCVGKWGWIGKACQWLWENMPWSKGTTFHLGEQITCCFKKSSSLSEDTEKSTDSNSTFMELIYRSFKRSSKVHSQENNIYT